MNMPEVRIPLFKPKLPNPGVLIPYLESIQKNGVYSNRGPMVRDLEATYANYCNTHPSKVIAVTNATLGLEGAITNSDVDNWIVPNYTFAATGLAVLNAGKKLFLADISPTDLQLVMPNESTFMKKDFGILPVLPFGAKPDLSKWDTHKEVVIDAAASLGTGPFDFSNLPEKWFVIFSLHATKVLGAGEGGLIICGSEESAEKIRKWINFGFSSHRESITRGTNAKMPEISAAYGLAAFSQFDIEQKEWSKVQKNIFNSTLESSMFNFTLTYPGFNPYWIMECSSFEHRTKLQEILAVTGIETRSWWSKCLSEMPGITGHAITSLQESLKASKTILGLPKFRDLAEWQVEKVVKLILQYNS